MNLHALPSLIGGIANFVLGIFVYSKNKKNLINRMFFLLCGVIAIWNVHIFGLGISPTEIFAVYWSKVFAIGLFLIPPIFLHFGLVFIGDRMTRRTLQLAYIAGFVFLFLHWSGYFVSGFRYVTYQYVPRFGFIYRLYIVNFFLVIGYTIVKILIAYKNSILPQEKNKFKYFFLAALLGTIIGSTNFLLSLGMNFYSIGYSGSIVFTSIVSYTIIRYR